MWETVEDNPNRLRTCNGGRSSAAAERWSLVWCQERVYKPDSVRQKQAICNTVAAHSGKVICMKKEIIYAEWLLKAPSSSTLRPHVLLTCFRFIKPCLREIQSVDPRYRPAAILVLPAENQRINKVLDWASNLPSTGVHVAVHVVENIHALRMFLDESWDDAVAAWFARTTEVGPEAHRASDHCSRSQQPEEPFALTLAPRLPEPVAKAILAALPTQTTEQVRRLLEDALPEHYED